MILSESFGSMKKSFKKEKSSCEAKERDAAAIPRWKNDYNAKLVVEILSIFIYKLKMTGAAL